MVVFELSVRFPDLIKAPDITVRASEMVWLPNPPSVKKAAETLPPLNETLDPTGLLSVMFPATTPEFVTMIVELLVKKTLSLG